MMSVELSRFMVAASEGVYMYKCATNREGRKLHRPVHGGTMAPPSRGACLSQPPDKPSLPNVHLHRHAKYAKRLQYIRSPNAGAALYHNSMPSPHGKHS